jgi:hypothetical protein
MKSNYNIKLIFAGMGVLLLGLVSLGFYSISSGNLNILPIVKTESAPKVKTYSFTTKENGKKIHWTAIIRNGNLDLLYKNDEKLSESEMATYKDMVFNHVNKLDESFSSLDELTFPDSSFYFNREAFDRQMKDLNERMKNFKFNFHFDSLDVNRIMNQVNKELEKLKDRDFFNERQLAKINEKLNRAFYNHNFDFRFNFDFDKLNMSLDKLNLRMKELNIKMDHLNGKMKDLKEFLKDVKAELIKDGYLNKNDNNYNLDFTRDSIQVNGKRLPENLLEKYKKLYKDHFGKEIDDGCRIIN